MKNILYSLVFATLLLSCGGSNSNAEPADTDAPKLVSTTPANNATGIDLGASIQIVYSENIVLASAGGITVNGSAATAAISGNTLTISYDLMTETQYTISVAAQSIKDAAGNFAAAVSFKFSTKASNVKSTLCTANATNQAQNLYQYLRSNYGAKIISGTMANVDWNTNEAEWVNKHTGKYPAMNCFDFMSMPYSWGNYSNTSVVENWWNAGGIVACCWHWNVPANTSGDYAFYYGSDADKTLFDVSKISDPSSAEYAIMLADIDKCANYLKLLKDKNIPILWRPLHEASGGWFWWGAKDAASFKALWQLMYTRFVNTHNLTNLIWIWTSDAGDDNWYPGDAYVDIIGLDLYNQTNASSTATQFTKVQQKYPNKIIMLSECGNVAKISEQWNANARWSMFMPWYDYNRTKSVSSSDFNQTAHQFADITWWNAAFANSYVISRDKLPSLK